MGLRNYLLAATIVALPIAAAHAQPIDGLYVGAGAGYNYRQDLKIRNTGAAGSGKFEGDGGFVGVGSVGYGLGNGFRVEVEGNYRQQHDRLRRNSLTTGGEDSQTYGAMANVLYEFPAGLYGIPVSPYIGAGAGYEWNQVDNLHLSTGGSTFAARSQERGTFAAQGIVGAAYAIPGAPGLAATLEYRFMTLPEDVKFKGTQTVGGVSSAAKGKVLEQYNHAILIGVRYAFNAAPLAPPPAPAPVAAPAPAPARTYLVFFDWDRADLTDRARQIIAEAAQNASRVQTTRIDVQGNADRSGTPAYNQRLSLRRAQVVSAELVRLGVPQAEINIQAFGDTRPLVPTAAGVREPQNRRVEIILH